MSRLICAGLVVGLVAAFAVSPASGFVRCKTADGKTLFVDVAPEGCKVESEIENRPAESSKPAAGPTSAPRPSGSAAAKDETEAPRTLLERRDDIERAVQQAAAERVRAIGELTSIAYPLAPSGGTPSQWESYRKSVDETAAKRVRLEREIADLMERIARHREEFKALSAEAAKANGGKLPAKFRPTIDCAGCP